ncbi:MAG: glycosyl hydrolase [Flavobacteriaceae bacterium]|nr:glycosyl hydrolase [Flavobacteriaceae bacterium]
MITNTFLEQKGNNFPNQLHNFFKEKDNFFFTSENGVILKLSVLRDSLIRFRYAVDFDFEADFSYAIAPDFTTGYNALSFEEKDLEFVIETSKLLIYVNKSNLKVCITDKDGEIILNDELGFHWEENYDQGGNRVKMSKVSQAAECYYGMGDKASHINLKGRKVENWVTDQYAFGKDQEPLYKAIPFYIGLHHQKAYGVFFDNSFQSFFDFGHDKRNVTSFWAEGGEMNYYFFYGPNMAQVVEAYSSLTGTPELPPLWALGFHQSKWSYFPDSQLKSIAQTFREKQIPCDAIYLDIDYMDGFRCFTWDKERFPDPKKLLEEMKSDGFKLVTIIDPGIKIDRKYWVYNEANQKGYFCRRADGTHFKGKVWPGECKFPDFTDPKVREWWADLYKEMMSDIGVQGVWNDMNEPAVMDVPSKTANLDIRHNYEGHPCSHRKGHNVYGMQMVRATFEGVKKHSFPRRPFVITRAAYAGTQRYASTWTGDNVATWEHLFVANAQVQRMCMSGYSFVGSDIGGFAEQPSGELFLRWIQMAVFHPFCRVHSSGDHGDQEPWSFGEDILNHVREFINLRYALLPYLYTAFYKYSTEGVPMIQSMVYQEQEDTQTYFRTDEFMFGDQMLVCPIQEANAMGRRMYFPKGEWYNYWTDELEIGGVEKYVETGLSKIPLFVKAGALIPKYPVQQYVGEKKIEELRLDAYYINGVERSVIYEDNQDGYDYKKNRFALRKFRLKGRPKELVIQQFKDGKFVTDYENIRIVFHGLPFPINKLEIDNEEVDLSKYSGSSPYEICIPKDFSEIHIIAN